MWNIPYFYVIHFFNQKYGYQIQRTHHLNQQVKNQTYGTEINRTAYHDELYLFDTMLSI